MIALVVELELVQVMMALVVEEQVLVEPVVLVDDQALVGQWKGLVGLVRSQVQSLQHI